MKTALKLTVSIVLCALILLGCSQDNSDALKSWYEQADFQDTLTAEQLFEAAKQEDTLVIYSTTTRIYDVKDSFETQYPSLTVEVYDTRAQDIVVSLREAYAVGETLCDVVICSDDTAELSNEFVPLYILNKYVPHDIEPMMAPEANTELLYFVGETEQLFYNSRVYDSCPVQNWWELTEPQWYGKVHMNSPLRSHPAYALVHGVIARSDDMAKAYEELYGEPLSVPQGSSAGEVFWQRLVANGVQFSTTSNELVEIVGNPNDDDPPLAFMISSKIRRQSIGLDVEAAYGISPSDGVYSPNSISIAGGAPNINSAKLFIRWLLGETDGTGEGLKPYLLEGTWPVRTDTQTGSPVSISEGNFWINDKAQVYDMYGEVQEFWSSLDSSLPSEVAQ